MITAPHGIRLDHLLVGMQAYGDVVVIWLLVGRCGARTLPAGFTKNEPVEDKGQYHKKRTSQKRVVQDTVTVLSKDCGDLFL